MKRLYYLCVHMRRVVNCHLLHFQRIQSIVCCSIFFLFLHYFYRGVLMVKRVHTAITFWLYSKWKQFGKNVATLLSVFFHLHLLDRSLYSFSSCYNLLSCFSFLLNNHHFSWFNKHNQERSDNLALVQATRSYTRPFCQSKR